MTEFSAERRLREKWPEPPMTLGQKIQHTLDAFHDQGDDGWATVATHGIYGPNEKTGITWGDLRAIMDHLSLNDRLENG